MDNSRNCAILLSCMPLQCVHVYTDADRCLYVPGVRLLKAWDLKHDESFYLCRVLQKVLQKCLLPLGEYPYSIIQAMAESLGCKSDSSLLVHITLPFVFCYSARTCAVCYVCECLYFIM